MKREKIGVGYFQSGYGRGLKKTPIIYLIEGKLYAKDKTGSSSCNTPLEGDLKGYVPVNCLRCKLKKNSDETTTSYHQVSINCNEHKNYEEN